MPAVSTDVPLDRGVKSTVPAVLSSPAATANQLDRPTIATLRAKRPFYRRRCVAPRAQEHCVELHYGSSLTIGTGATAYSDTARRPGEKNMTMRAPPSPRLNADADLGWLNELETIFANAQEFGPRMLVACLFAKSSAYLRN